MTTTTNYQVFRLCAMRKQGLTRHKVISSGRLTAGGRCQTPKKRVAVRSRSSAEPAYSLYSTDSEDQVTTIHKGLDRCAALLNGILQTEKTDATASSASVGKAVGAASRPLSTLGKERGQTKSRKQTKTGPAPVQKLALSSQLNPALKRKGPIRTSVTSSSSQTKFNCHLTTSTPADSPERPASNGTENTATTTRRPTVPPGSSSAPLAQERDPIPGSAPSHHGGVPSTNGPASHHPVCSTDPAASLHPAHLGSSISGGRAAAPPGGCGSSRSPPPPPPHHRSIAAESGPGPGPALSGSAAGEERQPRPRPQSHLLRSRARSLSHPRPSGGSHSPPSLTHDGRSQFTTHADRLPQSHLQIHTHIQPHLQSVGLANANANLQSALLANPNLQLAGLANANLQSVGLAIANANLQSTGLANANASLQSTGLASANANLQSVGLANANASLQSQTQSDPEIPPPAQGTGKGSQSAGGQEGVPSPGERHGAGAAVAGGDEEENEEGECEDDVIPVRDTSAAQTGFDRLTPAAACACSHPHAPERAYARPNPHPPHPQTLARPLLRSDGEGGGPERTRREVRTVQYLLGELKALLAGQGGVAERLVSDLEQTVSLLPVMVGSTNIQAEIALVLQPLRSENAQLRRRVRILNQQLQGRERAEREARPLHWDTEMSAMQVELSDTETQLQNLQLDNARLRQALEDTQSQLEQSGTENRRIKMALEERGRSLEDSQRDQAAWELVAQQRGAELNRLQQLLRPAHGGGPIGESDSAPSRPVLTKRALDQYQDQHSALERDQDPVSQYLRSLDQGGGGPPASPPCKGPPQTAQRKDTPPGQGGLGSSTLPGQSGLGSSTLPGHSGLGSSTLPGHSGLGSSTYPGQSGLGSSTLPGQSGLGSSTLPGQSGLGSSTLPGQSGLGTSILPGQNLCVSADHGLSVCVPVEKSVCASFEQDWSVTEVEQDQGGGACEESQEEGGAWDESQEEGGAWEESQEEGGASSPTGHQRLSGLLKALLLHPSPKRPARLNETSGPSDPLALLPNVPVNPQRHPEMGNARTPTHTPAPASFLSSSCDLGSLASDWTAGSSSTFDTRDEQEFRAGLAALDASIASLQRTIQQDLRR